MEKSQQLLNDTEEIWVLGIGGTGLKQVTAIFSFGKGHFYDGTFQRAPQQSTVQTAITVGAVGYSEAWGKNSRVRTKTQSTRKGLVGVSNRSPQSWKAGT